MTGPEELSRDQVVAHRVAVHGLVERVARPADLAVLDLGVQDTPAGSRHRSWPRPGASLPYAVEVVIAER